MPLSCLELTVHGSLGYRLLSELAVTLLRSYWETTQEAAVSQPEREKDLKRKKEKAQRCVSYCRHLPLKLIGSLL